MAPFVLFFNFHKFTVTRFERRSIQTASPHSAISNRVSQGGNFIQYMTLHIREIDTQSVLLYYVRSLLCKPLNIRHFMGGTV